MLLQMANFILSYGWVVFYYIYTFVLCCAQSCLTLCDPLDCSPPGSSVPGILTGAGCHLLLQGIFPTQGSNPGLLHWQADSFSTVPLEPALLLKTQQCFKWRQHLANQRIYSNTHWLRWGWLLVVGTEKMPEKWNKRLSPHLEGWDGAQVGGRFKREGVQTLLADLATPQMADSPVVQEKLSSIKNKQKTPPSRGDSWPHVYWMRESPGKVRWAGRLQN